MYEFQVAICDDQEVHIDHVCQYLAAYESETGNRLLIERYSSALQLVEVLKSGEKQYDIVLLDVDMPKMSGTNAAIAIREFDKETPICFITSFENYAYQAFQVEAMGYLVKPVKYTDFKRLMNRCIVQVQFLREKEIAKERFLSIKIERSELIIRLQDIVYIEKRRNKCVFHLVEQDITCYDTLAKVYERLNPQQFYYTHQGYIVNFDYILEVAPDKIYMNGGAEVPVSRRYYQKLRELHINKIKRLATERRAENQTERKNVL